jgi:hypothetical protein
MKHSKRVFKSIDWCITLAVVKSLLLHSVSNLLCGQKLSERKFDLFESVSNLGGWFMF